MAAFNVERITHVHHWNDTLFSFKTTRDTSLRFKNGQFVMIGLEVEWQTVNACVFDCKCKLRRRVRILLN